MSLVSALYTGQTGLESSSTDLSVIGDNIANSATVGFKASRADFSNTMAQQMVGAGGAVSQVGLGTELLSVQKILTQGALNNTGVATDLALDGGGFFVVKGSHNGQQGQFYTRDGQFTMDKSGYLVNQEGLRVEGYPADGTGTIGPTAGDLQLGSAASPALPTATVTIKANLDAAALTPAVAFDPTNPVATSNFSTSVTAFDSLGIQHQVDVYFVKTGNAPTGEAQWTYHALTDGGGLTGGTAGVATEIQSGDLTFDLTGKLATVGNIAGAFNPLNATQAQALTFNLGDDTGSGGTGLDGTTQFAAQYGATSVTQDGYGSGVLSSISIDKIGQVQGAFSNGTSRVIGQLAVATVNAADQMDRVGGNLFAETTGSGNATLGKAGSGGRGGIAAGALENSNVDLSNEFIHMITAQRNYQANAKTITTADALLQELMNLKR
ncbi:MAG TPA: flagellar hook protein FlgE [Polyangia bacterium]|jgi:flagellar hook protein FlgE